MTEDKTRAERRAEFYAAAGYSHDGSDPLAIKELNPDLWSDATWRDFVQRCRLDASFKVRAQDALRARGAYISEELAKERKSNPSLRQLRGIKHRIRMEAHRLHPRPHPTSDGWRAPGRAPVVTLIEDGMAIE